MRNNQNLYFKLYSNCKVVKGESRSTICDFQKGSYIFVTNDVADLIIKLEKSKIYDVLKNENNRNRQMIKLCLENLIKYDLGHYCKNILNFPELNTNFQQPNKINDCIIELSRITYDNFNYILKSLTNLGCKSIELRSYGTFSINKLDKILLQLESSRIRNVELYLKYKSVYNYNYYDEYIKNNQIIGMIVIHSAPKTLSLKKNTRVFYTHQKIDSANCCGKVSPAYFRANLDFYLESLNFNSCLNKKFSITKDGSIKNCPSMKLNYGRIINNSIEEIVNSKIFQNIWNINKDKIKICKSCEFRYICSDCRAYLENKYDKPKHCKYDPKAMKFFND